MASQDIYAKDWSAIHLETIKVRVQGVKSENNERIVLSKGLFDDLVKLAEVASRINSLPASVETVTLEHANGVYEAKVKSKLTSTVSGKGRTVVEAIVHGLHENDMKTNALAQ